MVYLVGLSTISPELKGGRDVHRAQGGKPNMDNQAELALRVISNGLDLLKPPPTQNGFIPNKDWRVQLINVYSPS